MNTLPHSMMKQSTYQPCLSYLPIPFDIPINLATVLKLPENERFNICNGVAKLLPPESEVCSVCDHASLSELVFTQKAMIVSRNKLIAANGKLHTS